MDDLDKTLTGLVEKYLRSHNMESHLQDQLDSHAVLAADIRLALRSAYLHGFRAAGGLFEDDPPETVFRDPLLWPKLAGCLRPDQEGCQECMNCPIKEENQ